MFITKVFFRECIPARDWFSEKRNGRLVAFYFPSHLFCSEELVSRDPTMSNQGNVWEGFDFDLA